MAQVSHRLFNPFFALLLILSMMAGSSGLSFAQGKGPNHHQDKSTEKTEKTDAKEGEKKPVPIVLKHQVYEEITSTELVQNPGKYLDKGVRFPATFNSFSSLGLDYNKALRESKDYISMLILRPDVKHHKIPLSELKLIYPREQSEAVLTLESGDKIQITGSVFSTALNDPWVDVEKVDVIEKVEKKEDSK